MPGRKPAARCCCRDTHRQQVQRCRHQINNLFNAPYDDYVIDSVFSAYPQPGRTHLVKPGATF